MMYQWYTSLEKLAKMYKNKWWKCDQQEGTFYHLWWTCTKARRFWIQIHSIIQKFLKINI